MSQAGKTEQNKERMSAYGAATTALRKKFENEFMELLQAEYDKRDLGPAPLSRSAARKAREEKVRETLAARLEKKRQELAELEAAVGAIEG